MDAPPDRESCVSFIAIANALRVRDLCAPEIIASDLAQGFLLLTDFGNQLYLQTLTPDNAKQLYTQALDTLALLQVCDSVKGLDIPIFSAAFMSQELELCKEWFLCKHLRLALTPSVNEMLDCFFKMLVDSAVNQPQVFMHRDYHSANLMVLPDKQVSILDFQDAFIGPVTYDLVSLLRDCYIAWPPTLVDELALYYKNKLSVLDSVTDAQFFRWFDLMGLQRHLKALLTFSRKYHRDNNPNYLQHIPRTLKYVLDVSEKYNEFSQFTDIFKNRSVSQSGCIMRGMILAAGRGKRMGELTSSLPKPLLRVGKSYLIEYAIEALKKAGIHDIIINVSYKRDLIKEALGNGKRYGVNLQYSEEIEALETGGGIFQALPFFNDEPFVVISSDIISDYSIENLLSRSKKLAHLVMVNNPEFHPEGDFCLVDNIIYQGQPPRLTFANIGIYSPKLFSGCEAGYFPLVDVLRKAISREEVTGEYYQGNWYNIGTPEEIHRFVETLE